MPHAARKPDAMLRLIGAGKLVKALLFLALGLALTRVLGDEARERQIVEWVSQLRPGRLTRLADRLLRGVLALPINHRVVLEAGAFAYAALFSVEGVGLLRGLRWAEWLTVVGTASLVPFEAYEIWERPTVVRVGALVLNLAVLAYLIWRIRRDARIDDAPSADARPRG